MIKEYVCPCCGQLNETEDADLSGRPKGGRVMCRLCHAPVWVSASRSGVSATHPAPTEQTQVVLKRDGSLLIFMTLFGRERRQCRAHGAVAEDSESFRGNFQELKEHLKRMMQKDPVGHSMFMPEDLVRAWFRGERAFHSGRRSKIRLERLEYDD